MFTISGYGIIGFVYQALFKIKKFNTEWKSLLKNTILFTIPTVFFEIFRIMMGYLKGPEHGVKYIYNAESYQQFVWFFKSILDKDFIPSNGCQEINKFISCYINETLNLFSILKLYIVVFTILCLFILITKQSINKILLINTIGYTLFSYIFISFQGLYQWRFIYYSLGFFLIFFFCMFIYSYQDFLTAVLLTVLLSYITLSRKLIEDYIDIQSVNYFEFFILMLLIFQLLKKTKYIKFK